MAIQKTKAPFPYFGGKSRIADEVWKRFGDVKNYVEPFAGSLAVFLAAPRPLKLVSLNDLDGFIVNFWRAVKHDPDAVAHFADWPVTEIDLFARHVWLVARKGELAERLMADPEYYDPKIAGWWVWGQSTWIGGGWCSGKGSWTVQDGKVVKLKPGMGVKRVRPTLSSNMGVHRVLPHLSRNMGVHRVLPNTGPGKGVHRKRPHLGPGKGVARPLPLLDDGSEQPFAENGACEAKSEQLRKYMRVLADKLRFARITCGDFERVLSPSGSYIYGLTGVFLDPPYSAERDAGTYATDSFDVAHRARAWCAANGDNPLLRIALCGYEGEHNELENLGWQKVAWKAHGGYAHLGQNRGLSNRNLERIWFSPHCLVPQGG